MLMAMNVGLLFSIFLAIQFAIAKKHHVMVLGWICTSVSIALFAAPLSDMIPNVIRLTLGIIQVLLYVYYRRADRETDIEGAVVQEDMGGGGESLVGGAPVLELVEVGGRIVEVAEGGGTEVAEGREVEEAEGTPVVEKVIVEEENVSNPVVEKFNFRRIISSSAKRVRLSDGKKGNPVVEKVIIEEENVSNPVVDAKERRKFSRAKRRILDCIREE
ncbi:hypothetical protein TSUD_12730 [Trifolium subterraneum]|uniref:Bidirectional sugar transporter SWEET n=1 Tax=Trifolium subterraneum TaxID=3900 RepID=A0A2Z6NU73_TRISU|nr:hypothetical protein TSUD_12730 [Trifolium subterraneum]